MSSADRDTFGMGIRADDPGVVSIIAGISIISLWWICYPLYAFSQMHNRFPDRPAIAPWVHAFFGALGIVSTGLIFLFPVGKAYSGAHLVGTFEMYVAIGIWYLTTMDGLENDAKNVLSH